MRLYSEAEMALSCSPHLRLWPLLSVEALGCLWSLRPYCAAVLPAHPSPEDYGAELLRKYHENLSEVLTDNQVLLKVISRARSLAPGEREVSRREGNMAMYTHIYIFYKYIYTAKLRNAKKETRR